MYKTFSFSKELNLRLTTNYKKSGKTSIPFAQLLFQHNELVWHCTNQTFLLATYAMFTMLTIIFTISTARTKIQIKTDKNDILNKISTTLLAPLEQKQKFRKTSFNNIIALLNTI